MQRTVSASLMLLVVAVGCPSYAQEVSGEGSVAQWPTAEELSAVQGLTAEELSALYGVKGGTAGPYGWQSVEPDLAAQELIDALTAAGVPPADIQFTPGDDVYALYERPVAPGLASYLVVPQSPGGSVTEFLGRSPESVDVVFGLDAASIRAEIIAGMEASLDSICGMRARPSQIRAMASVPGVLEIEATWNGDEVCNDDLAPSQPPSSPAP